MTEERDLNFKAGDSEFLIKMMAGAFVDIRRGHLDNDKSKAMINMANSMAKIMKTEILYRNLPQKERDIDFLNKH